MDLFQGTYVVGIGLMLFAALANASQNLLIRKGTDTGRASDAILIVMLVNIAILVPGTALVYYPDYALTTRSLVAFLGAGLFGTMFGRAFKYVSIGRIGASRTEPIIRSSTLVATVLGVLLLGERVTPAQLVAIVAIVAGVALISAETTRENPHDLSRRDLLLGMLLPFGGAVAYGIEPIFASVGLQTGTPAPIGAAIKVFGATLGFVAYLRLTGEFPALSELGAGNNRLFLLAGVGNTLFVLGYYLALGVAPVSVVVPILPTSTLFTVGLSALFMPQRLEHVTYRLIAGACVVVGGVAVLTVAS